VRCVHSIPTKKKHEGDLNMQVRDFMIYDVCTAIPTTSVKEVLAIFEKNKIGGVPVVDGKGNLAGIVTDGDIVRFLSLQEKVYFTFTMAYVGETEPIEKVVKQRMNTPISEIMVKKNLKTLSPDDTMENALSLLSKHHFKKLPVVNGAGRGVGIISRGDVINRLAKMTTDSLTIS
jgi:CBS domain-containing protein